ncbi:MAG: histidine kinase [Oscillospiraceae bacterium]
MNYNKREKLEIKQNTDIGVIAHHINDMILKNRKIAKEMINTQQRLYETELVKNTAALYALQNQVNPHFIYNSLECVRSIACVYDVKEIEIMVNAISNIMRYTLDEEKFSTVQGEVEIVTEYFKIMSIRFADKFTYTMDIDKNIYLNKMPRMILQPIIENAFKHGLIQSEKLGEITIKGYDRGEELEFIIKDNGSGMSKEKLEEIMNKIKQQNGVWSGKKDGIGLVNIDNRIKMYFNEKNGIVIDSVENEYTCVIIKFAKL